VNQIKMVDELNKSLESRAQKKNNIEIEIIFIPLPSWCSFILFFVCLFHWYITTAHNIYRVDKLLQWTFELRLIAAKLWQLANFWYGEEVCWKQNWEWSIISKSPSSTPLWLIHPQPAPQPTQSFCLSKLCRNPRQL